MYFTTSSNHESVGINWSLIDSLFIDSVKIKSEDQVLFVMLRFCFVYILKLKVILDFPSIFIMYDIVFNYISKI